jgi:hypothetical protein
MPSVRLSASAQFLKLGGSSNHFGTKWRIMKNPLINTCPTKSTPTTNSDSKPSEIIPITYSGGWGLLFRRVCDDFIYSIFRIGRCVMQMIAWILSRFWSVAIDVIYFAEWIYWTLINTTRNYKHLKRYRWLWPFTNHLQNPKGTN